MADFEAVRKARQEELEVKRKRLEEMRKQKSEREAKAAAAPVPTVVILEDEDKRAEVDSLVSSLLAEKKAPKGGGSSPAKSSSSTTKDSPQSQQQNQQQQQQEVKVMPVIRRPLTTVFGQTPVYMLPAVRESYDKECQTEDDFTGFGSLCLQLEGGGGDGEEKNYKDEHDPSPSSPNKQTYRRRASSGAGDVAASASPASPSKKGEVSSEGSDLRGGDETGGILVPASSRILSQEEQRGILAREDFKQFLGFSSKIVERALSQGGSVDILRDYKMGVGGRSIRSSVAMAVVLGMVGGGEEWLRGRPVMDIKVSPHYPELFLVAYGSKTGASSSSSSSSLSASSSSLSSSAVTADYDSAGAVCVWSTALLSRPEFKFFASSPVVSALFHPQEEHLLVGGCYNGQVVLWDMRSKEFTVQRSSLTGKGHKHPIYGMCVNNLSASTELVTASTDGTVCHWDITRLVEPSLVVSMRVPTLYGEATSTGSSDSAGNLSDLATGGTGSSSTHSPSISALVFGHASDATRDILVSSGTGFIYKTSLPIRNTQVIEQINAHSGPITSMHLHPSTNKLHRNLLLTSSLDWSVKLWNLHAPTAPPSSSSFGGSTSSSSTSSGSRNLSSSSTPSSSSSFSLKPLLEFRNASYEYVCDVQWSPFNPSLFCTITSGGSVVLWNISKSISEPVDVIVIGQEGEGDNKAGGEGIAGGGGGVAAALNKVAWSTDGRSILVGDSRGGIHIVSVKEEVAVAGSGDEGRFSLALFKSDNEDSDKGAAVAEEAEQAEEEEDVFEE